MVPQRNETINIDGVDVVTFVSTLSTVASETNHRIERWDCWGGAISRKLLPPQPQRSAC